MTYIVEFARTLTKKNNIGILVYLLLNVLIVVAIFSEGFQNIQGILIGLALYFVSVAIALSPIGEWILRYQLGCKKVNRKEYLNRLDPLFKEVYAKAKKLNPSIPNDVKLFMNNDEEPNAFATGRRTICITKGFLNFSDEEIKATLAHEFGHIAHKDTDLLLMITVGNLIVTALFFMYRLIFSAFTSSIESEEGKNVVDKIFIDGLLILAMWLWTKLGVLLVMHSSRQNEFLADEFSFNCGYGDALARLLDRFEGSQKTGLWANLAASHPDVDERVGRLQELGASYIKNSIDYKRFLQD